MKFVLQLAEILAIKKEILDNMITEFSMSQIIFQCQTKATNREKDRLRFSFHWIFARRVKLVLTDDELICGDWRIPYSEIEDACLVTVPTRLGSARNLIVWWRDQIYQFQIKTESWWKIVINPFWDGPLPFPVRREERRIDIGWRSNVD